MCVWEKIHYELKHPSLWKWSVGVWGTVQPAPYTFLASIVACSELVTVILPSHMQDTADPMLEQAVSIWQQGQDKQYRHPNDKRLEILPRSYQHMTLSWMSYLTLSFGLVSWQESGTFPLSSVGFYRDDKVI